MKNSEVSNFIEKEAMAISKSTFFTEHLLATASAFGMSI